MNYEPAFQRRSGLADPVLPIDASNPPIPLSTPKLLAVQFQGPSSTNSPNHIALAGSIAGVVVLLIGFVLWEFHRMRRRRRKFAQSDAEAAARALPAYGVRDEKAGIGGYAHLPSTTHLPPPPPPAYYSASYVPRR